MNQSTVVKRVDVSNEQDDTGMCAYIWIYILIFFCLESSPMDNQVHIKCQEKDVSDSVAEKTELHKVRFSRAHACTISLWEFL
jgi:hypothetical protein